MKTVRDIKKYVDNIQIVAYFDDDERASEYRAWLEDFHSKFGQFVSLWGHDLATVLAFDSVGGEI